jgi:anaerobic magnesium-protoporphyrin IX monomethyl ester cyclase
MRLALVFNPFSYKLHEENLRIVQRYFGLFPPLSMTWVAAIAEKAGHDVTLIDARTLQLSKDDVLDRLRQWKPDMIGFMMTTYMFRETLEWVHYLKQNLKVPVIIGGYNLRVYPKESVSVEGIDFGCFNSAFHTVPRLLAEMEGQRRFADVPGLIYKDDNGKVQMTEYGEDPPFESYPNPARHHLPNELYAEFPTERKNFSIMVTSKGCPMGCLFCEAGRTPYNARSPMTVVNEMEECYTKYNIREIDIFDYEFCIDRKRTVAICDEMIRRKLDILWACRARIDSVDEPLMRKMKAAGCGRIYFGIESGCQEILDRIHKGITLERVRETIGIAKSVGIRPLGFFLIGSPGETRLTIKKTVKFAKSLKLDYVQFSKMTAKPLTSLWQDLVRDTGYDYWKEYILGNAEEAPLPRPWVDLSNDEIDYLAKKAYVMYHCRPGFLLDHVLKVRSWDEFKRKASALIDMIMRQERVSKKDLHFVAYPENKGRLFWYKKISKWSQPF